MTLISREHKKNYLLVLITILIIPFFFIGSLSYYASPVYKELWNFGHIVFFATSSYLLLLKITSKAKSTQFLTVLVYCLLFGFLIEVIQLGIVRNFSYTDIYLDLLGGLFAFSLAPMTVKHSYRRFFITLIIVLILISQSALYRAVLMEIKMRQQFPVLADFSEAASIERWRGNGIYLDTEHKSKSEYVFAVKLIKGKKFTGFSFEHFPEDWRGYQQLNIVFFNPDTNNLLLNIKITDEEHDLKKQEYNNRFNHQFKLLPGWNTVSLSLADIVKGPKNRELSLEHISHIGFFMTELDVDKTLYIESIKLR